jgi:hypothetical protein
MSPRFDHVDPSGIEFRWDGKGLFEAGIPGRAGDFLCVESYDAAYGQPPTEENFLRLCEDFMGGGSRTAIQRRIWQSRQAGHSTVSSAGRD